MADPSAPKVKDFVEDQSHPVASGSNTMNGGVSANVPDTKARKPVRGPEPFDQSEREEMERLLEELRGHLGRLCYLTFRVTLSDILQYYILHGSSRAKTSRITSCGTLTGTCLPSLRPN